MKDVIKFASNSFSNTTYRMFRAPVVLGLSLTAMALAIPVSFVAAPIYATRMANANLMANKNPIGSSEIIESVPLHGKSKSIDPKSINFLPPLISNRILGYDQLAKGHVGAFLVAHLKELAWLSILGAAGVGAYFAVPLLSGVIGVAGASVVAAAVAFGAVQIAALIGKTIKGPKPHNDEDAGDLHQQHYAKEKGFYENLAWKEEAYLKMTAAADRLYLQPHSLRSLISGGNRLPERARDRTYIDTKNRI